MMHRQVSPTRVRVGNPLLACAYSLLALACEAAVILAVLRGSLPVGAVAGVALVAVVAVALRHPGLLLRTEAVPETL
jgi:hypothetical protein